jgi:hypothetical protein
MDFPKLRDDQYAVITAEASTGIVLRLDGSRREGNTGDAWRLFDSLKTARDFALVEIAKNPSVEFAIYDKRQQLIEAVRS